jgi:hypothetical protein
MDSNTVHLGISLVSGLSCLLPLAFQESNFEVSNLLSGLLSKMFLSTSVMIIALVIPIALDTLADYIIARYYTSDKKSPKGLEKGMFFNTSERVVLIFGMLICPMTIIVPAALHNNAFIYFCCNQSQLMITFGVLTTVLCRYKREAWSVRNTYLQLILFSSGTVSYVFSTNIYITEPNLQWICAVIWASWILRIVAAVLFFSSSVRWLFAAVHPKRKIFSSTSTASIRLGLGLGLGFQEKVDD